MVCVWIEPDGREGLKVALPLLLLLVVVLLLLLR